MSMMECSHCNRVMSARALTHCDQCHGAVCEDCRASNADCPIDDENP